MFLAAGSATLLALALLVLAKPLKARMFPKRKEARRVRLVVERVTPLAVLREEIDASEVPLERIVVRPSSTDEEGDAELVLSKGSRQEELLSLMEGLHRVLGVREVNSALANGSAGSNPEQSSKHRYPPECVEGSFSEVRRLEDVVQRQKHDQRSEYTAYQLLGQVALQPRPRVGPGQTSDPQRKAE